MRSSSRTKGDQGVRLWGAFACRALALIVVSVFMQCDYGFLTYSGRIRSHWGRCDCGRLCCLGRAG